MYWMNKKYFVVFAFLFLLDNDEGTRTFIFQKNVLWNQSLYKRFGFCITLIICASMEWRGTTTISTIFQSIDLSLMLFAMHYRKDSHNSIILDNSATRKRNNLDAFKISPVSLYGLLEKRSFFPLKLYVCHEIRIHPLAKNKNKDNSTIYHIRIRCTQSLSQHLNMDTR